LGYYRSRVEIMSIILEGAKDGTTKTKIIYKSFLSYSQFKEYLTVLSQCDLISYDDKRQILKTTEKGLRFLSFYNEIRDVIKELPQPEQQ
jgi:predicted transcriptional regulator